MDKTFQKLLRSGIDLSPVGVERREDNIRYFCTPKGASTFGWAGVDGIHFCFIRGFGGMIFAVSPMNSAPNHIHLLAKNFEDFLRLLLSCGDVAALEQAWMWDEVQFNAFLQENPPTPEQQECLSELVKRLHLRPMEHPWAYLKELQTSFDLSQIKYTEDYYDVEMNSAAKPAAPEWKVYFEGNFWGYSGRDHAGTEIQLNKHFDWAGHHWIIPSVYSCSKGLVIDFCMRTEIEDIRSFRNKWNLDPHNDSCDHFTPEQLLLMESENPLDLDFLPQLKLNGKTMQPSHSCSMTCEPCFTEGMIPESEERWALEHYELDSSYGWMIRRWAFPWASKRRPQIKSLSLTISPLPCRVPGPHFTVHAPGDFFTFSHPVDKTEYTLTVQKLEPQTISQNISDHDLWLYPTHFTAMSYTLSPTSESIIHICDCAESDKPVKITPTADPFAPETQNGVACIGIIGGADGPTYIMIGGSPQENCQTAYSSLHFKPVEDDIEWRIEFSISQFEDKQIELISANGLKNDDPKYSGRRFFC